MTISSPIYSFLQFNLPSKDSYAVPFVQPNDLAFQVIVDTDNAGQAGYLVANPEEVNLVILNDAGTVTNANFESLVEYEFSLEGLIFNMSRIDSTKVLMFWDEELLNMAVKVGGYKCFRLGIRFVIAGTTYRSASTPISLIQSEKYTSQLRYECDEDAMGFIYCKGAFNRVRLPLYLRKPQFPTQKKIYKKSDGSTKLISASSSKQFEVITATLDVAEHEKIQCLLNHDSIEITSNVYTGGFFIDSDYTIGYPDVPGHNLKGSGTFKAGATPYLVRNSNCATCDSCIPFYVSGAPLPDGQAGVEYLATKSVTGTQPIILQNIVKPSWMTIEIVDGNIVFSGVPNTTGTGIVVSYQVCNCNGMCGDGAETIDIAESEEICYVANIEGVVPNATVGVPYIVDLPITGNTPFVLAGGPTIPSWMTIEIDDTTLKLRGTPTSGDIVNDFVILFAILNCDGSGAGFEYVIDVADVDEINPPGNPVVVGYGLTAEAACEDFGSTTVYVNPPNTNITVGIMVYNNIDLDVPYGGSYYITDSLGNLFFSAGGGYITAALGTSC